MRLSLATAACVVSVALLAGCSNSPQGMSSVPGTSSVSSVKTMSSHDRAPTIHGWNNLKDLSQNKILALQAAGKFPERTLHGAFVKNYKYYMGHRSWRPAVQRDGGTCGLWNNLFYYSYMVCLTANEKKTVYAVSTASGTNYCDYPQAVKVDASGNAWTACEYANGTEAFALQEYSSSSGTLTNQYTSTCPAGYTCTGSEYGEWFSYAFDAAIGAGGNCGILPEYEAFSENASGYTYRYGTGVDCINASGDHLAPAWETECSYNFDTGSYSCSGSSEDCNPICEAWEGDQDNSGNIYYTYYGYNSSCFGGGVAEESGGATTVVQSPCLLEFPGGVYISNGGTVANVIDQDARVVYQFNLPITASSTPFRVLGPTASNFTGEGDPDSGGFNSTDTKLVIGDAYGWDDVGKVGGKKNKWSISINADFLGTGVEAAGYTPSDK